MFYADLHVHSKYSRATSRDCDLEHLALWAARKGIAVVATGDFTHPAWLGELEARLVSAEPGLYRLRPESEREAARLLGRPMDAPVRFMLQVEISTIYKKNGRTRKVHHLVYAPDLECARRFAVSLARIGNVASDGRPILGLDSRALLEIALASGEGCYLVPAHVWTPWFAVLGSSSGFDSIEECYADLTPEVFALETGLSSDPPMNRRLSALDRYALVSNSDAHSPPKLGRECCVFDGPLDYFAMREALRTGRGYGGTVEFFPEEGKYHLDGHRKCGVCLEPDETRRCGGLCPACGKPLTLGVMHRVCELADRPAPPETPPPRAAKFRSLVPLEEVLGELLQVGPQSKAVRQRYEELLARIGPELFILEHAPLEDVARRGSPLLAEAVRRMRLGQVLRQAGYDGEYGVIRLFAPEELKRHASVGLLFEVPEADGEEGAERTEGRGLVKEWGLAPGRDRLSPGVMRSARCPSPFFHKLRGQKADVGDDAASPHHSPLTTHSPATHPSPFASPSLLAALDPDQRAAAETTEGPLLIVAGPGTGKTRTLTHRIAHLVADCGVPPEACLAVTFSRRAAAEMGERLAQLLPEAAPRVPVMTFHALGLSILREHPSLPSPFGRGAGGEGRSPSETPPTTPAVPLLAAEPERIELLRAKLGVSETKAARLLARISRCKRNPAPDLPDDEAQQALRVYESEMRARGWLDFDDLILLPVRLLREDPVLAAQYRARYRYVSVDEFQDIDAAQYELLRLLVPPEGNLCAIGDPDQAIYGFRGADVGLFQRFREDFPSARTVVLGRNYRSTQTIVDAALQLISPASLVAGRALAAGALGPEHVEIHACTTDKAEAELVVHALEGLLGGHTFFSLDTGRSEGPEGQALSFSDVAVLYRTEAQAGPLAEALSRSGMPFQTRSHAPLSEEPAVRAVVRALTGSAADSAAGCGQDARAPVGFSVAARLEEAIARLDEGAAASPSALAALRAMAARCGGDVARFLSEIALGMDADLWDPRADRISLMTLHAAKGLEFPVVFITGCEDGIVPLRFGPAEDRPEAAAEERRLLFVGMTRARERLVLTHAKRRFWRGRIREMRPSPLLEDVRRELLAFHQHRPHRPPRARDPQRTLFE